MFVHLGGLLYTVHLNRMDQLQLFAPFFYRTTFSFRSKMHANGSWVMTVDWNAVNNRGNRIDTCNFQIEIIHFEPFPMIYHQSHPFAINWNVHIFILVLCLCKSWTNPRWDWMASVSAICDSQSWINDVLISTVLPTKSDLMESFINKLCTKTLNDNESLDRASWTFSIFNESLMVQINLHIKCNMGNY